MKHKSLRPLFVNELRDLHSGELWLTLVLPDLVRGVHSRELRGVLDQHVKETEEQLSRMERVFMLVGESPKGKRRKGMQSLVMECRYVLGEDLEDEAKDVSIISEVRRVKHYEIATYGAAVVLANLLRANESAALLHLTLHQEKEADLNLERLALNMRVQADAPCVSGMSRKDLDHEMVPGQPRL